VPAPTRREEVLVSIADAIAPSADELILCTSLRCHAIIAVIDAEDLIVARDHESAGTRLLQASELYRIAAHQLEREISATER
jgi:aminoglycoside N3'-acetyltransferase